MSTDAMAHLRARGITKRFGARTILHGIDLDVPHGAFAVLVGPSGCGKSTLLRVIAGLEEADEGALHFGDRDVTRLPPRDRDVAMVFQSYALYPHLSVRQNLAFGLRLRKTPAREIDARVGEAAAMLGLGPMLDRMPRELSGGERQRVAMGRAIVRKPAAFLFDEPLSNLDATLRARVRVDIRRLHDRLGATSVYVTHDQVEAMTLADVLFVMRAGAIEQAGAPLDVYARPATRFVASFLGSPPMNFVPARIERDAGRWFAASAGVRLAVDAPRFGDALREGRPVVAGVRPHDLRVADGAAGAPGIEGRAEFVEALGSESWAHLSVGGTDGEGAATVVARVDPSGGVSLARGATLRLVADPAHVHLFDPESERAIG